MGLLNQTGAPVVPYTHQSYPAWRYRVTKDASGNQNVESCIVQDAEEAAALGPGWTDSPAAPAKPAAKSDK